MYTATEDLMAATTTGLLDPRVVLEQLNDRHFGKAPEPDVDLSLLSIHCKEELKLQRIFLALLVLPVVWISYGLLQAMRGEFGHDFGDVFGVFVFPLTFAGIIEFIRRLIVHRRLIELRRKHSVVGAIAVRDPHRRTVVVFSGFDAFQAYGVQIDTWSLVIDIEKPVSPNEIPVEFTSLELTAAMRLAIANGVPTTQCHGVLFARGTELQRFVELLPTKTSAPLAYVENEHIGLRSKISDVSLREYSVGFSQISNSQAVLATFFRCSRVGAREFVECRQYVIPSLRPDFHVLSNYKNRTLVSRLFDTVVQSAFASFFLPLFSAFALLAATFRCSSKLIHAIFRDPLDNAKFLDPNFDYGHKKSLRMQYSASEYDTIFQSADKEMLRKTVNSLLLTQLVSFLKARKIDVGDLESSKQQIFNSGVIVTGGNLSAENFAVGDNSRVVPAAFAASAKTK